MGSVFFAKRREIKIYPVKYFFIKTLHVNKVSRPFGFENVALKQCLCFFQCLLLADCVTVVVHTVVCCNTPAR